MIYLIYIYLLLISGSLFLALKFDKKIEQTLSLNIMIIVFLLYIFGLFGILKTGVYLIEIISIILFVYSLYLIIKNKINIFKNIITPGLVIFTLFYLFLIIFHNGRLLTAWDEFSHWGDVVKAMFSINDFSTSSLSASAFQSYPPAMSLFQYFFVSVRGIFLEHYLFISYQIFGISLFLPFIKNITWTEWKKIFYIVPIVILAPLIFNNSYYTTIYIDTFVGMTFAHCVALVFITKEYKFFEVLNIGLSLFVLVLTKDVGLFFAIIILAMIINDLILIYKKSNKEKKQKIKKIFKFIVIFLVSITFAKISWNLNIKLNNADTLFSSKINLNDLKNILLFNDNTYRSEVLSNFILKIGSTNIITSIINLDFIKLITVFAIAFIVIVNKVSKEKKFIYYYLVINAFIYLFGLLVLYLFNFSEYEAVNLASWERYISIYFIALICFMCFICFSFKDKSTILVILLSILILLAPIQTILYLPITKSKSIEARSSYIDAVQAVQDDIDGKSKIWIISQNDQGYDYWVLKYSFRPNNVQDNANENYNWSLGTKYYDGDIWTIDIGPDEWMKRLMEYDYVYIYKVDEQFIEEYSSIFSDNSDIKEKTLFKVNKITKKLEK